MNVSPMVSAAPKALRGAIKMVQLPSPSVSTGYRDLEAKRPVYI
jgi:hypothetical protein